MIRHSDNTEYNKRYKRNLLEIWWSSVDRISMMVIFTIIAFSIIMVITASPAVAERIGDTSTLTIYGRVRLLDHHH